MSQNIHCSSRPPLKVFHTNFLVIIFLLLTDPFEIANAQRAINNVEHLIQNHHQYPSPNTHNSNVDNSNDNELDLYDEPLFWEESEFNEHNLDSEHQHSPFKNVIHATQLDSGLTIIPSIASSSIRPEQQQNYQIIYLPAILPIHKHKLSENKSGQICSNEINSPAIYDLEAILWTIDQINQLIAFKNSLIFNLAVLDSCSSPAILERRLNNILNAPSNKSTIDLANSSLPSFEIKNIIGFIASIASNEFTIAHSLLAKLNITLISAQDISFLLPAKLGFEHRTLQTALPIEYFASAALQHLKQQNKHHFSIIYSNASMQSTTMLDALLKWITFENSKSNQLFNVVERKKKQQNLAASFCMQSILDVPLKLNTGEASQLLIQLQNEIKNVNTSATSENTVLILTDSHTTRELLIAYQHLLNAGILNRFAFILVKESNLNIVTGIESSMLNTLVIRESQKSLRDFVEYFEQLKADNNLRNPFFKQYWQQSVNCGLNRDCLFDQIEPINTINTIQSTYALINSIITIRNQFCLSSSRVVNNKKKISIFFFFVTICIIEIRATLSCIL